ncbi:BglG family transcription antiterminator [Bacillus sp. B1-b2]|uniref:BglG family transcription antiterminator n=1 Tax=Bacillus sp. B1-b2 TaxID=2653201 RepID=UPI001869D7AF|nr:PRD domain-containing protein [Bacillus sp. B1-b2]
MSDYMHERHTRILEILRKEKRYVTAKELAKMVYVSPKTIYRDMQQISEMLLTNCRLVKRENQGYYLESNSETDTLETYTFDCTEERRLNLMLFLLSIAPCKTSIQKISERYFVSQSSILHDFNYIDKILKNYHLKLQKNSDGTYIKGDQLSIHRLMAIIIECYLTQIGDPFRQYDIPEHFKGIQVKNNKLYEIKRILHEIQIKHDMSLDQPYYLTLFCSLLSMIEKHGMKHRLLIKDVMIYEEMDQSSPIFKITKDIVRKMEVLYNMKLIEEDIHTLYYILKAFKLNSRFLLNEDTEAYMRKDVTNLARALVTRVTENSGYRFVEDSELLERLTLHMHAMVYRISHEIYIINPILKSIKANFSYIFEFIKTSAQELKEEGLVNRDFTDEEIGYITLYFQISYDDRFANQIPILIECTSGIGSSHLLSEKIRRNFPNIHIKKIIAQQRIKKSDYEDVELVISTVKRHSIIDKPTILVSPILNHEDKYKIDQFIREYYNQ